jgi:hypothetical protein
MPLTRQNVDFAHSIAKARDNLAYGYGGVWNPTNIWRTTDCSGIVTHMLDAVLNGPKMGWSRYGISTESYRYVGGPGSKGPFGTIRCGSVGSVPKDAVLKIGLHHGYGGGANSHMACTLEGVNIESSGHDDQQYGGPAWGFNNPYFHDWFYLPGTVDGAAPPYSPPVPSGMQVFKVGSTGAQVKKLQDTLNRFAPAYSALDVDGEYGPKTAAVVSIFQRRAGLLVDGEAGPATLAALGFKDGRIS